MAKAKSNVYTGANLGSEAKLWQMADGLRSNMDVAEHKHVVLGQTLASLRDALLPKLLSGELQVAVGQKKQV